MVILKSEIKELQIYSARWDSEKHRRSIGEASEKQRKADLNDIQQKLIRHGSPKNGYWEIVDE